MGDHLVKHGDGVKDVAFEVEDLDAIFKVIVLLLSWIPLIMRLALHNVEITPTVCVFVYKVSCV